MSPSSKVFKWTNTIPCTAVPFYLAKSSLVTLSQVDGRRDDRQKDDMNETQGKLRGNVYKALYDGVFEADIKEEKWVTGTELIGGEFKTDEDFEEEINDSHD